MPRGAPGVPKSLEHREKLRASLVKARAASRAPEAIEKMRQSKIGTPAWNKGVCKSDATYTSVHNWLRQNHPRTGVCERCDADVGTARSGGTQWSFNRHPEPHTRNRDDYEELCRPCHTDKDKEHRRRKR